MILAPSQPGRLTVMIAGGAGAVGSALLCEALADARFAQVVVLTQRALHHRPARLLDCVAPGPLPVVDFAILHIGRPRSAREAVFWNPRADGLLTLATALRANGTRALQVALARDDAELSPSVHRALKNLGFDHLVVTRPAATAGPSVKGSWPQRYAAWMLRVVAETMSVRAKPPPKPQRKTSRPSTVSWRRRGRALRT